MTAWRRTLIEYNNWRAAAFLLAFGAAVAGCQPAPDGGATADDAAVAAPTDAAAPIEDDVGQASYSLGYTVATNMEQRFAGSLDNEAFMRGLRDKFAGRERVVSAASAERSLNALVAKQQQAMDAQSENNQQAGADFLAENGKRESVVTLDSGLQYEVLVPGEGDKPGPTDTVTTHYHGTLIDGTVFDSSVQRGEPASFPLNRVIPGWTEALQLMPVGAKWRLYIPPDLAYGNRPAGAIPPNSTLIFDVELLDIQDSG